MKFIIATMFCLLCSYSAGNPISNLVEFKNNPRIIGGHDSDITQFPSLCSLQLWGGHSCGCTILNKKFLVTAAHCIFLHQATSFSVICGITQLNETDGITEHTVARVVMHPSFDILEKTNDIAIVELDTELIFNDKIQPIEIADNCFSNEHVPCEIVGWGSLENPGSTSNNLQQLDSQTQTFAECQQSFSDIINTQICAYTKVGEGTCKGDSGGPMYVAEKLWGIVSWGKPCALGYPDVFTRVGCFKDWIEQEIS